MKPLTIRVLIVDDDASVRDSLGGFLSDQGFDVGVAASASEGLNLIAYRPPDIAIVDLRLGDSSGEAFILAARKSRPELKIVIYTASNSYQLPRSLEQIGLRSSDVLHKPVSDLAEVSRVLKEAVASAKTPP